MAVEQHRNISKAQIICQAAPATLTIASPSDSPAAFAHQGFGTRDHSQPTYAKLEQFLRKSRNPKMASVVIAFDLYGTLLSTESISHELARIYGEDVAKVIAVQARRYQLEYTWRINSMGESRN
jgi:hypothetical protein